MKRTIHQQAYECAVSNKATILKLLIHNGADPRKVAAPLQAATYAVIHNNQDALEVLFEHDMVELKDITAAQSWCTTKVYNTSMKKFHQAKALRALVKLSEANQGGPEI